MRAPRRPGLAIGIVLDGRPKYQIAASAGIPPNLLGGIITGRCDPTPSQRQRLAEVLGRSESELFDGGDE